MWCLPRTEVHSICNNYIYPFFILACIFADQVIWQSGFTHALVHVIFTSKFSLPPPPTHHSLLLHHLHIQGGCLHSICQLPYLVPILLLLKGNEKVMEAPSAPCIFLAKPLDIVLIYVYLQWPLANPVLKTKVCRSPASSQLNLLPLS